MLTPRSVLSSPPHLRPTVSHVPAISASGQRDGAKGKPSRCCDWGSGRGNRLLGGTLRDTRTLATSHRGGRHPRGGCSIPPHTDKTWVFTAPHSAWLDDLLVALGSANEIAPIDRYVLGERIAKVITQVRTESHCKEKSQHRAINHKRDRA